MMHNGKRILVVDDEAPVREALARVLHLRNYAVVPVADGEQARQRVQENGIDLALVDVELGDENGWELAMQLRAVRPSLPIVAVTASPIPVGGPHTSVVQAVFEKPLELGLLLQTMQTILAAPTAKERQE